MITNFLDDPNESKKIESTKFGYLGHPNNQIFGYWVINQIFGYSVIWVTKFGNSGDLKKIKETKFGNNHPKLFRSLIKKWNLS
jgi:hypothetical protein